MVPISNAHSKPEELDCVTPGEQNVMANSSLGDFPQFPTPLPFSQSPQSEFPVLRKRRNPKPTQTLGG